MAVHPTVRAIADALEESGIRTILTPEYSRGGPVFLVARGGKNKALQWINNGDGDPSKPQIPREVRRYIQWLNYGQEPNVPTAVFANTPAEAVAAANYTYAAPAAYPAVILPPSTPTPTVPDDFSTAFKHSMLGHWTNYSAAAADRVLISEAQEGNPSVSSAIVDYIVKNGDSPGRAETWCIRSDTLLQANDIADLSVEVSFPASFPAVPTARWMTFARLSAFTNGLSPLEFMVRQNGSGVDTIWLRENGPEHDLASQTTLDAAGGYLWSKPLVRAVNYSNLNWTKLTARVKFSTDPAQGWIELYASSNRLALGSPIVPRTFKKTLTDTSGTVRDYFRVGINRHSSITGDMRIMIANARCHITRPP